MPVRDNENTNNIVTEVTIMTNMKITPDQISTFHRLQAKSKRSRPREMMFNETPPTPPSIIVRFRNRDIRNELYSKRISLRQADLEIFSIKGTNHIFINENLTYKGKKLFWMGK